MADYRFYFFGLIMHIENDGKGHSAVLWDDHHSPRLMFSRRDRVNLRGIGSIDIAAADLAPGPARRQPTFETYVPSAQQILGGTLAAGAATGTGGTATYLHHMGGDLFAARSYAPRTRHLRDGQEARDGCVSVLTVMLLRSDADVTVTAGNETRRLSAGACVLLANFDDPGHTHDPHANPHVQKYAKLTHGSDTRITMETLGARCPQPRTDPPCDWVARVLTSVRAQDTSAHPECGNSSWP